MDAGIAERQLDLTGDVVGAFDEVDHGDRVADAFAAVGPHEGIVADHAHRPPLKSWPASSV